MPLPNEDFEGGKRKVSEEFSMTEAQQRRMKDAQWFRERALVSAERAVLNAVRATGPAVGYTHRLAQLQQAATELKRVERTTWRDWVCGPSGEEE